MKTVLVHIDHDDINDIRLESAISLASRFNAHLIGTHIMEPPEAILYPSAFAALPVGIIAEQRERQTATASRLKTEFEDKVKHAGLLAEWRQSEGSLRDCLARQSRSADLTMVSQTPGSTAPDRSGNIASSLVLASGLPVLSVPGETRSADFGKDILIAWNNSQQAARAVHDALPILKKADRIIVANVGEYAEDDLPTAGICAHLARHDLEVETIILEAKKNAEETLLEYASSIETDLIVAGAWGHMRAMELMLGGFTRRLLKNQKIPVFISH